MNPLFELVTATPEIIEKLEDDKDYQTSLGWWSGRHIKKLAVIFINKSSEIYLPHTEEKKVSEERLNSIADEIIEANTCSGGLSFQEAKASVLAALSYFSVYSPSS